MSLQQVYDLVINEKALLIYSPFIHIEKIIPLSQENKNNIPTRITQCRASSHLLLVYHLGETRTFAGYMYSLVHWIYDSFRNHKHINIILLEPVAHFINPSSGKYTINLHIQVWYQKDFYSWFGEGINFLTNICILYVLVKLMFTEINWYTSFLHFS